MTVKSRSLVLLAAGQGSRMWPLTEKRPKSMLEVGGVPLLKRILDELVETVHGEIVVVIGYQSESIDSMINRFYKSRVRTVRNELYYEDVNILSADIGVNNLINPEYGYTIIETDLLVESAGWQKIFNSMLDNDSFWVTHGVYSKYLTGGIVHENERTHLIDNIAYIPNYEEKYNGWHKMLGILSVSPENVEFDRLFRKIELQKTIKQYYMNPWIKGLQQLPCKILNVSDYFATSFNTPEIFQASAEKFLNIEK